MFEKRQVITVLIRKQQHGLHQECLSDMQVKIRFSDSIRKPGEATSLIITAEPGSQVAVTAVDKSVHLLKGGNDYYYYFIASVSSNSVYQGTSIKVLIP